MAADGGASIVAEHLRRWYQTDRNLVRQRISSAVPYRASQDDRAGSSMAVAGDTSQAPSSQSALARISVEGRQRRFGGSWPAFQRLLRLDPDTGPLTVRIDGTRTAKLDATSGVITLPAGMRAEQQLGHWVTFTPPGTPDGESRLAPAVPRDLPDELRVYLPLLTRLAAGTPVPEGESQLVDEAVEVWRRPGFDTMVSAPRLRFEPFPYQLQAAETALRRMRGRAILADEVGLGKTIEAGLILSELYLRGLAEHVLILVPAGLVEQWCEELDRKFALPFLAQGSAAWEQSEQPWQAPIVVVSLATARRAPTSDLLAAAQWDLVILDEAHRLKNPRSASARLAASLRTRRLLLLTATPVENRLDDLFQLVNLVRPGHLGTPQEFRSRYAAAHEGAPAHNVAALQARMRDVMIRHRRSEVALMLPRRLAETLRIAPAAAEAELYRLVSERVRDQARAAPPSHLLTLRSIQRLAGSNPRALAPTLEKVGWRDLAERAASAPATAKARVLLELLRRYQDRQEKVIVFTAFRQTLGFLEELATAAQMPAVSYHGSLTRREKDAAIQAFRTEAPVLLTTEAAGEGRNLQFSHVMVNFDLPWNPMQIEQRLGRIHRIGQQHDVVLTNLVTRDTIEERILGVLEAKVNLFELVVGELDMILGRIDEDFDFERFVFSAYVESHDDQEFGVKLEALGDDLARARHGYLESRQQTDELLPEPEPASA
jgi:SNF2 family DNA or RNA helicase